MEKQALIVPPPAAPTTKYIKASSATFKDLVQKLTGGAPGVSAQKLRPKTAASRRSPFKLQDRRKYSVGDIEIIKQRVGSTGKKTRSPPVLKGPTTPLGRESVFRDRVGTESPPPPSSEEERAIAEKGFYLHASPGKAEIPVLLTLFPLTSPNHEV
ncbi:hypothetical protein ABFX02_01G037500 [Erythranthe guttata]